MWSVPGCLPHDSKSGEADLHEEGGGRSTLELKMEGRLWLYAVIKVAWTKSLSLQFYAPYRGHPTNFHIW